MAINNCKTKKTIEGFTIIEIMIAVVIFGIIIIFGGNYFYSLIKEHRISVQNDYLYREATYAMDFIINGRMLKGKQGVFYRYDGIITYHSANIPNELNADSNTDETTRIELNGDPNAPPRSGRIYTEFSDRPGAHTGAPNSLWIEYSDGPDHMIIPTEDPNETLIPYEIDINFIYVDNNHSFIDIELVLSRENEFGREIEAKMNSKVRLRN